MGSGEYSSAEVFGRSVITATMFFPLLRKFIIGSAILILLEHCTIIFALGNKRHYFAVIAGGAIGAYAGTRSLTRK